MNTAQARDLLTDPRSDDEPKLAVITALLGGGRLLVVFDDFEQNLTPGGQEFLDPAISEVMTTLADAAQTGALLITCRYPLPGPDRFLADIPVPALSAAELRRMFLRLPALAELDPADQRLLTRTVGGHPRLIEFTDALLRGGRSSLRHVQTRLRDLAQKQDIDLRPERPVAQAVNQAMILGSADILLTELLALLTPRQAVLAQVAVCRAPMTLEDLAFTFSPDLNSASTAPTPLADRPPSLAELRADTAWLADLTLLAPGQDIAMHPWTAALVTRNTSGDPTVLHERALEMRWRRFDQRRGSYDDLLDIPRHLVALHRYDDIAATARRAVQILPGTLAALAYLAEIRPLVPPAERAWILVADLEVQALLSAGNLPAATRQLEAIHQQVQTRAAADPANTGWQRDLRQPQQARRRDGRSRGPGHRPRPLPGRPRHRHPAGRRRPRQRRMAARPVLHTTENRRPWTRRSGRLNHRGRRPEGPGRGRLPGRAVMRGAGARAAASPVRQMFATFGG